MLISVEVPLKHVSLRADVCFDAMTEGATGGRLVCRQPVVVAKARAGTARRIVRPAVLCTTLNRVNRRGTVAAHPYTSVMAHEDTVLEEAMDNLKEAGQHIRATQSLMRSEGMTDG